MRRKGTTSWSGRRAPVAPWEGMSSCPVQRDGCVLGAVLSEPGSRAEIALELNQAPSRSRNDRLQLGVRAQLFDDVPDVPLDSVAGHAQSL
jgi:hypothetical protein